MIALALGGRPTLARQALASLHKSITSTGMEREYLPRMLNGLVLVAEDKLFNALPELRAMEGDGFAQIGIVEAYRKAGKKAEAQVTRDALFAKKDFDYQTSAIPIAHFRLKPILYSAESQASR